MLTSSAGGIVPNGSTAKAYLRGTHRLCHPEETLARLKPLLPRMGITRLANVTGLDRIGIPVVMAVRPNSQSLSVSQGKGLDLASAKVSAAMESAESFHAESIDLPLRLATYNELRRTERVADPELLPLCSRHPFQPSLPQLWVEGEDWMNGGRVWVPFTLIHTKYTKTMRWELTGFRATSTGLASGNHLLEATSHALCEAVERDCSGRFYTLGAEEQESLRIDLDSVADPDCRLVLDLLDSAGMQVGAWDITNPAGIAAVRCAIHERTESPLRQLPVFGGFGCHPCPEVAMLRALTEAVQSRLTMISGARDDMPRSDYDMSINQEERRQLIEELRHGGSRSFSALPRFESSSFEEDIAFELECLRRAGCPQAIVVNLSKPELGIAVVRVIVPGVHDESHQLNRGRSPEELL